MTQSASIRINHNLYELAKHDAFAEHRTISGQIEFWAQVGRTSIDNPDLPVEFIMASLASLAVPRENSIPFVPRSGKR